MDGDAQSHRSRATGVSRKSSIASRQSQLIKKNTGESDDSCGAGEGRGGSPSARPSLGGDITGAALRLGWTERLCLQSTGPTDLRPSDILIERFEAWKNITKNLIAYFEGELQ